MSKKQSKSTTSQFKLAYFGDSFCRPSSSQSVKTFVDLVNQTMGQTLQVVCVGRAGGTNLTLILDDMRTVWQRTPWDLALIFHEPRHHTQDARLYLAQQQRIVEWCQQHDEAKVIHCIDTDSDCVKLEPQQVDRVLLNYTKWTSQYRWATDYDHSDNAVDQVGNWLAAERILWYIKEHQRYNPK